jgi:putative ABC transport system permease protein
MHTLRVAIRALSRRPGFAAVAVLTLALGIGANTAIFSVIDAVLLRPLPYPDADRIVTPWEYSADVHQRVGFDRLPSSPADFTDFQARQTSLEHFASVRGERVNMTGGGEPERVGGVRVTPAFFDVLGVRPILGRTFLPEDAGQVRMVLIAQSLWERRFGSDPGICERTIFLDGEPARVVGVLPRWFGFPSVGEVPEGFGFSASPVIWTLDILTPEQRRNRGGKSRVLIGKLKPGVSIEQAEADLAAIAADIAREFPRSNAGWTVRVIPLREQIVSRVRPALMVLLTAVGFVLFIACANVANLLLVRATTRQRELTIRSALGATRARLIRELLTESLVLAALAGVAGLVIGWWTLHALLLADPASLPALATARVDLRVVAFTFLIALGTGVAFGLVPALQATRGDAAVGLRDGARGIVGGGRAHRIRNGLVVVEVALAVLLLVGVALLVQTFLRVTRVPTGFSADRVLTMEITLPKAAYQGVAVAAFFETLVERLSALPGVEAAGATSGLPLSGHENLVLVTIAGAPPPEPGREIIADYRVITPRYFAALQVPLRQGEGLPRQVPSDDTRPAVINETMARTCWPGQSPLGRRIKLAAYEQDAPWYTVVGVVGDTRDSGLDSALRPQVYVHLRNGLSDQMAIVVRTSGDPMALAAPARAAASAIDTKQPVARIRTMDQVIQTSVANRRFHVFLVGMFAALAVTLSLVGLYAIVAYSVAERMHELGVRVALGARPADLLTLVLTVVLKLVAGGIVLGLAAAFVLTRFLEALLFGVHARDAATFVLVPFMLLAVAMLGCLIPARRAMRVDAAVALRSE